MATFSTVLTADCLEPDEVIYVATNSGARTTYPWRLVVENEVMYVQSGVAEGLAWTVHRGADDTDPAIHLAGTIVTGIAVGQAATSEALVEDGVTPADVLIDDAQTDVLTSDPTITGV